MWTPVGEHIWRKQGRRGWRVIGVGGGLKIKNAGKVLSIRHTIQKAHPE